MQRYRYAQPIIPCTCNFLDGAPHFALGYFTESSQHGVGHGGQVPSKFGAGGGVVPEILSCCKILSTRLLALGLQCWKMCFLPLQQDFYSKSGYAFPQPEFQSDLRMLRGIITSQTAIAGPYPGFFNRGG